MSHALAAMFSNKLYLFMDQMSHALAAIFSNKLYLFMDLHSVLTIADARESFQH